MQKNMVRACGLSLLAALSLMAFAAAGAQAETLTGTGPGVIRQGAGNVPNGTIVLGNQDGLLGTLLIPALNTELVCEDVDVLEGKVLNGATGEALGEVLYLGCEYWGTKTTKHAGGVELLELTTKLPCEILEHSASLAAKAIVAKAKLLVVLHKNPNNPGEVADTYVLVEPDIAGQPLASILITTPSECPLPKLVSVTGSTVFKVTLGDLNLGQPQELYVLITSSKTIAKLFTDQLLFGANQAFIDGSALLWLATDANWGLI